MTRTSLSLSLFAAAAVSLSALTAGALAQEPGKMTPPGATPASSPFGGANAGQPALPVTENSPFEIDANVFDWGRITDEGPVRHAFKLKNRTNQTVKIVDIKTSCGCSTPHAEKREYAPGDEGIVEIEYNPKGRRGQETKTITITTDYASQKETLLHLKAFVLPQLVVEPSSIWFGEVPLRKGAATQELRVISRMPGFEVSEATIPNNEDGKFVMEPLGSERTELDGTPVTIIKYRLGFTDKAGLGVHTTQLALKTNDPKNAMYNVSLAAKVVGELNVAPEKLLVAMSGPKQFWKAESMVTSRDGSSFDVISVEPVGTPPGMAVAVDVKPREAGSSSGYVITATGLTPDFINNIAGAIRVRTSAKDMAEFTLPLMGLWRGPMNPSMLAPVPNNPQPTPPSTPATAAPTAPAASMGK